jgi:hypothetical protein
VKWPSLYVGDQRKNIVVTQTDLTLRRAQKSKFQRVQFVCNLERSYRRELGKFSAAARDDDRYGAAFAACCGYFMMTTMCAGYKMGVADQNVMRGITGMRERIVHDLQTLAAMPEAQKHFPELTKVCGALIKDYAARWPDATGLPMFPVFQG